MKKNRNKVIRTSKVRTEVEFNTEKQNWSSISAEDKNDILGALRVGIGDILEIIEKVEKIPTQNDIAEPNN